MPRACYQPRGQLDAIRTRWQACTPAIIVVMGARRGVQLALRAVVLAAVAGCGDGGDVGAGSGAAPVDVVPFERRPVEPPDVSPADEVAGHEVPECTSDLVTFEVVEVLGGEAGVGGLLPPETRTVALMARSGERCGLSGWPALHLTASEGHPDSFEPDVVVPLPAGRLLLTGRQRIVGVVRWYSSCAPPDADVGVEATLAGGDTVWAPLPDRPGCDPSARNTGGFFQTFPASPFDSPLKAELVDLPERAPFDGTLQVVVELSNPSPDPVSLDPCPVYRLAYGESGTVVDIHNEMNCAAAPDEIPAGGALRFAAELDLPREEIPRGFEGTVIVQVYVFYLDDAHGSHARAELATE
jgi:hypothetical protein